MVYGARLLSESSGNRAQGFESLILRQKNGALSEWSKVPALKAGKVFKTLREFESTHAPPQSEKMKHGAVAQLGERCVRNAEVEGSIPFRSTMQIFR